MPSRKSKKTSAQLRQIEEKLKIVRAELARRKKNKKRGKSGTETPRSVGRTNNKKSKSIVAECKRILKALTSIKAAQEFLHPFDWRKVPNASNYPQFCPNAMDFETVSKKLENEEYKTFYDFVYDINLIVTNAICYNGGGMPNAKSPIAKDAFRLSVRLYDELNKVVDHCETSELTKSIVHIWTDLSKQNDAAIFKYPVPVEALKISEEYNSMVKKPMDLRTIFGKIHKYTNYKHFIQDMYLVFDNCMLYNGEKTVYHNWASKLKDLTNKYGTKYATQDHLRCMANEEIKDGEASNMLIIDYRIENDENDTNSPSLSTNGTAKSKSKTKSKKAAMSVNKNKENEKIQEKEKEKEKEKGNDSVSATEILNDNSQGSIDNNSENFENKSNNNNNNDNNNSENKEKIDGEKEKAVPWQLTIDLDDLESGEYTEEQQDEIIRARFLHKNISDIADVSPEDNSIKSTKIEQLSYEQQTELQKGALLLDHERLAPLLQIFHDLAQNENGETDNEEIELDIEKIPAKTQVEMYIYVCQAIKIIEDEKKEREAKSRTNIIDTTTLKTSQNENDNNNNNNKQDSSNSNNDDNNDNSKNNSYNNSYNDNYKNIKKKNEDNDNENENEREKSEDGPVSLFHDVPVTESNSASVNGSPHKAAMNGNMNENENENENYNENEGDIEMHDMNDMNENENENENENDKNDGNEGEGEVPGIPSIDSDDGNDENENENENEDSNDENASGNGDGDGDDDDEDDQQDDAVPGIPSLDENENENENDQE